MCPRKEVYSLWLLPVGKTRDDLQRIIADFSRKYSTPRFEPHVTLIGEIQAPAPVVKSQTENLATLLEPFKIRLREVAYLDRYFRCVFIKAEKTNALIDAHSKACAVLDHGDDEDYMPHLSLVYGNLAPSTKRRVVQEIENVLLVDFEVKDIHLYNTGGQPEAWHRILRVRLGSKAPG